LHSMRDSLILKTNSFRGSLRIFILAQKSQDFPRQDPLTIGQYWTIRLPQHAIESCEVEHILRVVLSDVTISRLK